MTRFLLIISLCLALFMGVARAEDFLSPAFQGPKPPGDLLSTYGHFVEAARKGDSDAIKSFLLPSVTELSIAPRDAKTREYGANINLPFLRDGFTPAILVSRSSGTSQFLLRTASSAIFFVKVESVGWRIYRYNDQPIQ